MSTERNPKIVASGPDVPLRARNLASSLDLIAGRSPVPGAPGASSKALEALWSSFVPPWGPRPFSGFARPLFAKHGLVKTPHTSSFNHVKGNPKLLDGKRRSKDKIRKYR